MLTEFLKFLAILVLVSHKLVLSKESTCSGLSLFPFPRTQYTMFCNKCESPHSHDSKCLLFLQQVFMLLQDIISVCFFLVANCCCYMTAEDKNSKTDLQQMEWKAKTSVKTYPQIMHFEKSPCLILTMLVRFAISL